ncbi:MAG: polysaccharide deacetylase family protein [Ignavibacteriae bacterium]|nr:polysaccharide deacetylase family protein [Ignavibacteriota bacterium]
MLNDFYGEEKFNEILKNLWGSDIVSPIVLTHDVETIDGLKYVPKVLELEEKYGFKSSWNVVPYLYDIPNEIINLIKENGCEVGVHGYNHDGKDFFSKNLFDKRVVLINKAIENFGGVGYRSPAAQRNLEWMQSLNIKYDSSCFDVDPYQPMPGGTHFIWPFMAGKFVELPYTLPQDHVLWIQLGEKNIDTWKKKTEWLMKYNGMILLITHPDYLMIGENMKLYEEFLIYVKGLNGVRNMLAREVAEFVIQNL